MVLAPATHNVDARITGISMFKNGYAVVRREIDVPGPGALDLTAIPRATLGTLWFSASDGTVIDSVKTITTKSNKDVSASSMDQVLQANVGKQVKLGISGGDEVTKGTVQGKLLSEGDVVIVQTSAGIVAFQRGQVSSVSSLSDPLSYTVSTEDSQRGLEFTVEGRPGKITMLSLEQGASWSPAYCVDISDPKKLSIVAKSTVINDLQDMKDVDARFVTGFPNIIFSQMFEPLTDLQWPQMSNGQGGGPGGGGFGARSILSNQANSIVGGQGIAASGGDFMSYNPTDNSPVGQGMRVSSATGEQIQDLFFYEQPDVSLSRGERAYYVLFRAEAPYSELYTWDTQDPIQNNIEYRPSDQGSAGEVWHTLQFKNTSGHPLTSAPALTLQNGQVLGQDTLYYTSVNGEVDLRITRALDVRTDNSEEEVSRQRGAIKNTANMPMFDLVTLKGTMEIANSKPEPVTLRIRHDFTGELVSAEGDPQVKKTAKGLHETNPTGRLIWTKTIEAGKRLDLSYTYQVYVRS